MLLVTFVLALDLLFVGWTVGAIARAGLSRFRWAALLGLAMLLLQVLVAAKGGVFTNVQAAALALGLVLLVSAMLATARPAAAGDWC